MAAKVAAGIAGGVIVAATLWLATGHEPRTRVGVHEANEAVAKLAPPVATSSIASTTEPAPPPEARTAPERESRVPLRAPCRLAGRVTDTRGRGLAEATLELLLPPPPLLLSGPEALPLEAVQALEHLADEALTSGADGALGLELPGELEGRRVRLRAACAGHVPLLAEVEVGRPFALALQALPAFEGRLLDRSGGPVAPPGTVRFVVLDASTGRQHTPEVEIDADGRYRAPGLPLGRLVRVEACARGFAPTHWPRDQVLEPDRTHGLDLPLDPGALVTGTVLDAHTGEPIPGALVWADSLEPEEGSVHPRATTDERGRFTLTGAGERLVHEEDGKRTLLFQLMARAEGYVGSPTRGYLGPQSEERRYDFELRLEPASCALELELALADGSPARKARIWCIDSQGNPRAQRADDGGGARIEGLPAGTLGLWIECREPGEPGADGTIQSGRFLSALAAGAEGTWMRRFEFQGPLHALRAELELVSGEARRAQLVLAPPPEAGFRGRVVDAQGRGVAGLTVRAHLNFERNGLAMAEGADAVVTDTEGRYEFTGQHAGKYELWVDPDHVEWACTLPTEHVYVVVGGQGPSPVEDLVVGRCLTLEGRVDAGARDPVTLRVVAREPHTRRERARTEPEADGSFRLEPLVAQEYELVLLAGERELDRAPASPANASGHFLRAR